MDNTYSYIEDYFNFESHDIQLHQIKKKFDSLYSELIDDSFKREYCNYLQTMILDFQTSELNSAFFPILQTKIGSYLESILVKIENKSNNSDMKKIYFLFLVLSRLDSFQNVLQNHYKLLIAKNYFGISPKIGKVITEKVLRSNEYDKFIDRLAEWYVQSELIVFYNYILKKMFNISFQFDEDKFGIDNNFAFSMKSFIKKHSLKLASYLLKKCSVDLKLDAVNVAKMVFLLGSSFAFGINMRYLAMSDFSKLAFMVFLIINSREVLF